MVIYRVSSKRHWWLIMGSLIIILACLFIGCDGGDGGELETTNKFGSLAFQIQWEKAGTSSAFLGYSDQVAGLTELDCEEEGVFWINAIIYNQSNQYITESGPWPCGAHATTISVPEGSDQTIVIFGKNAANEILYRGQKSNIDVSENKITDAGLIVAYHFLPTGGNDTDCETTVNHSWPAIQSAASYEFQIATDVSFASLKVNMIVDDTETGCIPGPIDSGYYWRVRAIDFDEYTGAWSQIWVHGTPPPPGPLPAPTGGNVADGKCEAGSYYFFWDEVSSARSYDIQVSTNDSLANPVVDENVNNPTDCIPLSSDIYYWRVRTISDESESAWSEIWVLDIPPAPTGGNSNFCYNTGSATFRSFAWQAVQSAASYHFQLSTDNSFTNLQYEININNGEDPTTICLGLAPNVTIYWRVNTIGENRLRSAWSQTWLYP